MRPSPDQRFADLDHVPVGMAVVDRDLKVVFWNETLASWTGLAKAQTQGRPLQAFSPTWKKPHYARRLDLIFQGGPPVVFSPLLHPHLVPSHSDPARSYHVKATAIPDGTGASWALLCVEDITVLSRRIEELKVLHAQQDRMMREIHHRVKNNLNMISGLINLQRFQNPLPEEVPALEDLQSRIVAISEIHDLLYHSSNLSIASTAEYLEHLAHLLDRNLSIQKNHELVLDLDRSASLKTDSTVLLGLIQAELMTNALKYGLGSGPGEMLTIRFAQVDLKTYEYELSHSGDRLPADFDPATSTGLGMVLLTAYASQLGTTLSWAQGDPTRFWLRFST